MQSLKKQFSLGQILIGIQVLIGILFLSEIYIYSINAPMRAYDDCRFFLDQFQQLYVSQTDLFSKFTFLFEKGNWPHPKIVGRLSTIFSYHAFGEVNFKFLNLIGNLALLLIWLLLYKVLKSDDNKLLNISLKLLPVSMILFNYGNTYVTFWTVGSIGFYYYILFSLSAIYYFINDRIALFAVALFLTIFSSGLGFSLVFFILTLGILFRKKIGINLTKKQVFYTSLTVIVSILLLIFVTDVLEVPIKPSKEKSPFNIISVFSLAMALLGQIASFITFKNFTLSFIFGLIGFFALLYFIFKDLFKNSSPNKAHLFFSIGCLYLLLIVGFAALMRDNSASFTEPGQPRYHIYSFVFWSMLFLRLTLEDLDYIKKWILYAILVCMSGLYIYDFIEDNSKMKKHKDGRCKGLENVQNGIFDEKPYLILKQRDKAANLFKRPKIKAIFEPSCD